MKVDARLAALVCAVLALLAGASCGGGGGGGGGGGPTPPMASLTFSPGPVTGVTTVALMRTNAGASELVLDLVINGATGLYGVSFDLTYPSTLLRLESVTEGTFFSEGGTVATSLLTRQDTAGTLVVGLTRLGSLSGRTGAGTALSVRFRAIGSGSGSLQFSSNAALDAAGRVIAGVGWAGGNVQVQL